MLHLVNSRSRRWRIIVCQVFCLVDESDWFWDLPASVTMPLVRHRPCLCFSIFVLQPLIFLMGLSQWPTDLVLHFTQNFFFFFFSSGVHPCLHVSLPAGCITPELPVNVFLITCFYWKPRFPVLPPHLWVRPDWAPTSVHRAERQPRPLRRSIITTPAGVYGKPLSR